MAGVLIVSDPAAHAALKSVFAAGAAALCCASAGEARRALLGGDYALLIVNTPLPDEFGRELAITAVDKGLDAILLCAAPQADKIAAGLEKHGVLVLPRPLSRQQAALALRLLRAGRQRMRRILEENQRLTKRLDDARVTTQAKCLLALHEQMTEAEAHRHIEKLAMDARVTRRQIAQSIIRRYEGEGE